METLVSMKENLTEQSKAYGYTLSIWGVGALLLTSFKNIGAGEILAYIGGGVLGFGLLTYFAFKGILKTVEPSEQRKLVVASMVHILASLGNVLLAYASIVFLKPIMVPTRIFLVLGVHATLVYNLLLLLEHRLSEILLKWEARTVEKLNS
ncbi:MAG: hypothetical protein MUP58_02900 [Candidatus Nanohaloarchaeota archaeon QJJ-9]|nr:hypothetical protein [Candidatus Nanohaloarchaeota archaeon QJJ-9]